MTGMWILSEEIGALCIVILSRRWREILEKGLSQEDTSPDPCFASSLYGITDQEGQNTS